FPLLRSYGKYSYAIYIFHWSLSELLFAKVVPLNWLEQQLGSLNGALGARLVVVAIVTYGIAWLSWHVYEKRFLRLKRYFYARPAEAPGRERRGPAETAARASD
ncbi:MAG: hypothetical protein GWO21_18485, partial [Gammaproteobacteria bacterium]|nr:hypothetical protein [Gammaproteobacteria bacterium]